METKRTFKQECKDFWEEHGPRIKTGAKWLGIGLAVGFIKGALTVEKMRSQETISLLEKLDEKDPEDYDEFFEKHESLKNALVNSYEYDECEDVAFTDNNTGLMYSVKVECIGD